MFSLVRIDNDLCRSYYEVRIPTATPSIEDKEPLEEVLALMINKLVFKINISNYVV